LLLAGSLRRRADQTVAIMMKDFEERNDELIIYIITTFPSF
jgi:hypothetical protein